jgi:hypothetical protein
MAYYLMNAAQLAWGVPGREELALINSASPGFWQNWSNTLRGSILGGMVEYAMLAVIGGALVGVLTGSIYLHLNRPLNDRLHTR